jgi:hypothetical protein
MAQHAFSGIAVLVALTFLIMAVTSCASTEQAATAPMPGAIAGEAAGVPEFHGAQVAPDALRDRLPSES